MFENHRMLFSIIAELFSIKIILSFQHQFDINIRKVKDIYDISFNNRTAMTFSYFIFSVIIAIRDLGIQLQPRSSNRPQPQNLLRILSKEEFYRDIQLLHVRFSRR